MNLTLYVGMPLVNKCPPLRTIWLAERDPRGLIVVANVEVVITHHTELPNQSLESCCSI